MKTRVHVNINVRDLDASVAFSGASHPQSSALNISVASGVTTAPTMHSTRAP